LTKYINIVTLLHPVGITFGLCSVVHIGLFIKRFNYLGITVSPSRRFFHCLFVFFIYKQMNIYS